MKESKNIDRLYQEKFRDFEQTPSAQVWDNIEQQLDGKSNKRRFVWFWFGGIAAGLSLLFTLNKMQPTQEHVIPQVTNKKEIVTPEKKTNNPIPVLVNTDHKAVETTIKTKQPIQNTTLSSHSIATIVTPTNQNNAQILQNKQIKIISEHTEIAKTISEKTVIADELVSTITNKELTSVSKQQSLEDESTDHIIDTQKIVLPNDSEITMSEKTKNKSVLTEELVRSDDDGEIEVLASSETGKWSVSPVAAPVFLNFTDHEQSTIHEGFSENLKEGLFSKAYGMQVAYQVTNRISIQSGVHIVDYGYRTHDVYVSPTGTINKMSNIEYEAGTDLMEVNPAPNPVYSSSDVYQTNSIGEKGNITQTFGYIELPLEAKFRVINGDFGLSAIGGFSTLLLNKNDIYIETETFSNKIGRATNMNNVNFSGNLGLELDYKLYKNLRLNVSPMFKMQTNTFQKGETKQTSPYSVGVYSGLNFWF